MIQTIWLIKMVLSHLLTDFVLQPASWVKDRKERHFASGKLYIHAGMTALVAWIMAGWHYWIAAIVILVTHTLIDGWKSYRPDEAKYFVIDQFLHLIVIAGLWYLNFNDWRSTGDIWERINHDLQFWKVLTGFVFITWPAGIIIGELTKKWRIKVQDAESLGNAGKWIGIAERVIVLILVLLNQYSAMGLLITAKGIIRFNEKDRQEVKTEYLVVGTLLSIGFAVITGLLVKYIG